MQSRRTASPGAIKKDKEDWLDHGGQLMPENKGIQVHVQGHKGHQGHNGVLSFLFKSSAEGEQNTHFYHQQQNPVAGEGSLQKPAKYHKSDLILMYHICRNLRLGIIIH